MTRIVVCVNHYPLEVLAEGATAEDAQRRCNELSTAHRATKSIVARYFHFHVVPVREVLP